MNPVFRDQEKTILSSKPDMKKGVDQLTLHGNISELSECGMLFRFTFKRNFINYENGLFKH